jgi:glutathione S-transferase
VIAGLTYPTAIGVMGGVWAVNRVVYAIGYKNSGENGGKGRYYGIAWQLSHYGMMIMSAISAYKLATKA